MGYADRAMVHAFTVRGRAEPVAAGKIIALGRNYRAHAREMGQTGPDEPPLLFFKPASALVPDGGQVIRPRFSISLHHEVELVVAIGRGGRDIPAARAFEHVLGYAVGLDMTLRDVQSEAKRRGHPWAVAKGFDTSAPLSPVVPAAEAGDPEALAVALRVNGELRQQGRAADMILRLPEVVAYVSSIFTLEEGDLVFTGTPEGVGEVYPGDVLEATLAGLTRLEVTVAGEPRSPASRDPDGPRSEASLPGGLRAPDARRAG
jgi:2-keto-4-pentenoate hydratase/2-oxohepta-3-ene-1,7-dioic acid hydratase in catechol pathway